jgi:hypothetical protein
MLSRIVPSLVVAMSAMFASDSAALAGYDLAAAVRLVASAEAAMHSAQAETVQHNVYFQRSQESLELLLELVPIMGGTILEMFQLRRDKAFADLDAAVWRARAAEAAWHEAMAALAALRGESVVLGPVPKRPRRDAAAPRTPPTP